MRSICCIGLWLAASVSAMEAENEIVLRDGLTATGRGLEYLEQAAEDKGLPFVRGSAYELVKRALTCPGVAALADDIEAEAKACLENAAGIMGLDKDDVSVTQADGALHMELAGDYKRALDALNYEDAESSLEAESGVDVTGNFRFEVSINYDSDSFTAAMEKLTMTGSGSETLLVTGAAYGRELVEGSCSVEVDFTMTIPEFQFSCSNAEVENGECAAKAAEKYAADDELNEFDGTFIAKDCPIADDEDNAGVLVMMARNNAFVVESGVTVLPEALSIEWIEGINPNSALRQVLEQLDEFRNQIEYSVATAWSAMNESGTINRQAPRLHEGWASLVGLLRDTLLTQPVPKRKRAKDGLCLTFSGDKAEAPHTLRVFVKNEVEAPAAADVPLGDYSASGDLHAVFTDAFGSLDELYKEDGATGGFEVKGAGTEAVVCGVDLTEILVEWVDDRGQSVASALGVDSGEAVVVPREPRFQTGAQLSHLFDLANTVLSDGASSGSSSGRRRALALSWSDSVIAAALRSALPFIPEGDGIPTVAIAYPFPDDSQHWYFYRDIDVRWKLSEGSLGEITVGPVLTLMIWAGDPTKLETSGSVHSIVGNEYFTGAGQVNVSVSGLLRPAVSGGLTAPKTFTNNATVAKYGVFVSSGNPSPFSDFIERELTVSNTYFLRAADCLDLRVTTPPSGSRITGLPGGTDFFCYRCRKFVIPSEHLASIRLLQFIDNEGVLGASVLTEKQEDSVSKFITNFVEKVRSSGYVFGAVVTPSGSLVFFTHLTSCSVMAKDSNDNVLPVQEVRMHRPDGKRLLKFQCYNGLQLDFSYRSPAFVVLDEPFSVVFTGEQCSGHTKTFEGKFAVTSVGNSLYVDILKFGALVTVSDSAGASVEQVAPSWRSGPNLKAICELAFIEKVKVRPKKKTITMTIQFRVTSSSAETWTTKHTLETCDLRDLFPIIKPDITLTIDDVGNLHLTNGPAVKLKISFRKLPDADTHWLTIPETVPKEFVGSINSAGLAVNSPVPGRVVTIQAVYGWEDGTVTGPPPCVLRTEQDELFSWFYRLGDLCSNMFTYTHGQLIPKVSGAPRMVAVWVNSTDIDYVAEKMSFTIPFQTLRHEFTFEILPSCPTLDCKFPPKSSTHAGCSLTITAPQGTITSTFGTLDELKRKLKKSYDTVKKTGDPAVSMVLVEDGGETVRVFVPWIGHTEVSIDVRCATMAGFHTLKLISDAKVFNYPHVDIDLPLLRKGTLMKIQSVGAKEWNDKRALIPFDHFIKKHEIAHPGNFEPASMEQLVNDLNAIDDCETKLRSVPPESRCVFYRLVGFRSLRVYNAESARVRNLRQSFISGLKVDMRLSVAIGYTYKLQKGDFLLTLGADFRITFPSIRAWFKLAGLKKEAHHIAAAALVPVTYSLLQFTAVATLGYGGALQKSILVLETAAGLQLALQVPLRRVKQLAQDVAEAGVLETVATIPRNIRTIVFGEEVDITLDELRGKTGMSKAARAKHVLVAIFENTLLAFAGGIVHGPLVAAGGITLPDDDDEGRRSMQALDETASPAAEKVSYIDVLMALDGLDLRLPFIGRSMSDLLAPSITPLSTLIERITEAFQNSEYDAAVEAAESIGGFIEAKVEGGALLVEFGISHSFSEVFDFDFDAAELLDDVGLPPIGGIAGSGQISLDIDVTVALVIRVIPGLVPLPFLVGGSGLTVQFALDATDLYFHAALTPIEVDIEGASLEILGKADGDPAKFTYGLVNDLPLFDAAPTGGPEFEWEIDAKAEATLPIAQLGGKELTITIPDVDAAVRKMMGTEDGENLVTVSPNPSDMLSTLGLKKSFLSLLTQNPQQLVAQVAGILDLIELSASALLSTVRIPLIADRLRQELFGPGSPFSQFRGVVVGALEKSIGQVDASVVSLVAKYLQEAASAIDENNADAVAVFFRGKDFSGSPTELAAPFDSEPASEHEAVEWQVTVKKVFVINKKFAFALGLDDFPLGLSGSAEAELSLGFTVRLAFGYSSSRGVYIKADAFDNLPEVEVYTGLTFPNGLAAEGRVLFLEIGVTGRSNNDGAQETEVSGSASFNLVSPNSDGVLDYRTLKRSQDGKSGALKKLVEFLYRFEATTELDLQIELPDAPLPKITAGLYASFDVSSESSKAAPSLPAEFKKKNGRPEGKVIIVYDMEIDLTSMLFALKPIFDKLDPVLTPVGALAETITGPIPGLSDLLGKPVGIADLPQLVIDLLGELGLAKGYAHGLVEFPKRIVDIIELIQSVAQLVSMLDGDDIVLPMGTQQISPKLEEGTEPVRYGTFSTCDIRCPPGNVDVEATLAEMQQVSHEPNQNTKQSRLAKAGGIFQKLVSDIDDFPIKLLILRPANLLRLITGRDFNIIGFQTPKVDVDFSVKLPFGLERSGGLPARTAQRKRRDGGFRSTKAAGAEVRC
ncbi:hypothetical protein DIPPA_05841 [Diplonema papillatum]|nr:hypothetical protein DIPPA_05841 [Diplonema papillatum]